MAFENQVFINCPFDNEYKPMLKAIVFTLIYLELDPVLSVSTNAAENRLDGIMNLIKESKYSIHDLSRMQANKKGALARFNMPFELGIDFGCRKYGEPAHQEKYLLVLDEKRYRYQAAISDISGSDIFVHEKDPEKANRIIRNWIRKIKDTHIDSAFTIWQSYNEFRADFEIKVKKLGYSNEDINDMPWNEQFDFMREWIESNAA